MQWIEQPPPPNVRKSQPRIPVNVTLLGKRVLADVTKDLGPVSLDVRGKSETQRCKSGVGGGGGLGGSNVRMKAEIGVTQPQAKGFQKPPDADKRKGFSLEVFGGSMAM